MVILLLLAWIDGWKNEGSVSIRTAELRNATTYLTTPTYDTSGQSVHPDILYVESGWNGYDYWMAMTPYPNSNSALENPSILVSNDGLTWIVPLGLVNPIDPFPGGGAHNADVDLILNNDSLWVYYIEGGAGNSFLKRRRSTDGINWEAEENIFNVPDYQILSQAIVKVGATFYMWYVDGGALGCYSPTTTVRYRTSADGVTWSAPAVVNISQQNYRIWHLDVIYNSTTSKYSMLFAGYHLSSNCNHTVLFYARSNDRINWTTYNKKALNKGSGWDSGQIYRATMLYNNANDILRVWYSAQSGYVWHIGYTQVLHKYFLNYLMQ